MSSTIRFCPRLLLLVTLAMSPAAFAQNPFTRGDVNCDGAVDLLDPYKMSKILFLSELQPCDCPEAMDANVDGALSSSDTVFLLRFLTLGGAAPAAPFPSCGPSPGSPLACIGYPSCPLFKRGDANQDGCVSNADARFIADFLFSAGAAPACELAADANDDDLIDNMDVLTILSYCNGTGSAPAAPGPLVCGDDPTPGALTCASYSTSACASGCRNQLPGDCNQDGRLDIADPVCLFKHLFVGTVVLPCGDGTSLHPSNVTLMDANGSNGLDISDGSWMLKYLFLGGPRPVSGTSCMYIPRCPQNLACSTCEP